MYTTHDIRARLSMSQREFSNNFKTPYRTVCSWDYRGMPEYLHYWLEVICDMHEDMAEQQGALKSDNK